MLTVDQYAEMYRALEARGVRLVNTSKQYHHCHHLPESYHIIKSMTPGSVWIPGVEPPTTRDLMAALEVFEGHPVIVKDFVRSQKHSWSTSSQTWKSPNAL